jgi:hypothetical protein
MCKIFLLLEVFSLGLAVRTVVIEQVMLMCKSMHQRMLFSEQLQDTISKQRTQLTVDLLTISIYYFTAEVWQGAFLTSKLLLLWSLDLLCIIEA